ncbi:protease B nonderepressible form [Sorochytrium milnesiophthora]
MLLPLLLLLPLLRAALALNDPSLTLFVHDASPPERVFTFANVKLAGTLGYKHDWTLRKTAAALGWPVGILQSLTIWGDEGMLVAEFDLLTSTSNATDVYVPSAILEEQMRAVCHFVQQQLATSPSPINCAAYNEASTRPEEYLAAHISKAAPRVDVYERPFLTAPASQRSYIWHLGSIAPDNIALLQSGKKAQAVAGRTWKTRQMAVDMTLDAHNNFVQMLGQRVVVDATQDDNLMQTVYVEELVAHFGQVFVERLHDSDIRTLLQYDADRGRFVDAGTEEGQHATSLIQGASLAPQSFHPWLQYSVHSKRCNVCVYQHIPASFLVDPYQLRSSKPVQRMAVSRLAVFGGIELEQPVTSRTSRDGVVLMCMNASKTAVPLSLPLHLRYHPPGQTRSVSLSLSPPRLLSSCPSRQSVYVRRWNMYLAPPPGESLQLATVMPVGDVAQASRIQLMTTQLTWIGSLLVSGMAIRKYRNLSYLDNKKAK